MIWIMKEKYEKYAHDVKSRDSFRQNTIMFVRHQDFQDSLFTNSKYFARRELKGKIIIFLV